MFPQALVELREQLQGVVAQDLFADTQGVLLLQVTAVDFFSEHFRQTASRSPTDCQPSVAYRYSVTDRNQFSTCRRVSEWEGGFKAPPSDGKCVAGLPPDAGAEDGDPPVKTKPPEMYEIDGRAFGNQALRGHFGTTETAESSHTYSMRSKPFAMTT